MWWVREEEVKGNREEEVNREEVEWNREEEER